MYDLIFISFGILIILIFFFSVSVIHIRTLRDGINVRWYNLVDKLQYRQDLLPILIETARLFITEKKVDFERLTDKTIKARERAGTITKSSTDKIVNEHEFSRNLKEIIDLCETVDALRVNSIYLEIKKEINDIEKDIHRLEQDYNEKVRNHNNVIGRFYNLPAVAALRFDKKNIFEFE
jgi:hypothetical protein